MLDPVRLPSSGQVVDRSTILTHLRSSETDPFTQRPLQVRELQEEPDLQVEIQHFLQRERGKAGPVARLD